MGFSQWPLFDYFPALRESLNPVSLCNLPTPIERAERLGDQAWVKRDDASADGYGGNKMRKLEFVLAEIKRRGARRVTTLGANGSNAAVAAAMVCQQQQLPFQVITFPQPDSPTVQANQALLEHYGARILARDSLMTAAASWLLHPRRFDPAHYFMYAGCSQPVAVFAYINAALELGLQVQAGECPMPGEIVVAAGSGATVAGLSIGAALALPGCTVHAVQVAPASLGPIEICTPGVVERFRRQAWRELRRHAPRLVAEPDDNLIWHENYLGDGYGVSTLKSRFAMERARQLGLTLEPTYTGKAFAAFCDLLNVCKRPTLYWNTWSSVPLPDSISDALPRAADAQVRSILPNV